MSSIGGHLTSLGLSGLRAAQAGLATTAHNIANAGTAGYSRQRVELVAGAPILGEDGYLGTGVRVADVRRDYDQFLTRELQADTAAAAALRTQHGLAARLDALLSDEATSLAPRLQGYFDALEGAAAAPTSAAARQAVLDQAEQLAGRVRLLDGQLQQSHAAVAGGMRTTVEEINGLVAEVARLNQGIARASGIGAAANDLLDQRDELVRQLSERLGITTQIQGDGSFNLFIGRGVPLVVGGESFRLAVDASAVDQATTGVLLLGKGGAMVEVTGQIQGGALGAYVAFERGLLADAERQLGELALGLAEVMNAQHRMGLDQRGALGGDLFTPIDDPALKSARALAHASNTGDAELTVTLTSVASLQASDYRLTYDGAEYRLVRTRDERLVGASRDLPLTFAGEGFRIDLAAGAMAAGDSFTIRPSAGAAAALRGVLSDGASLALAAPVRAEAAVDNRGTARIGSITATDLAGTKLDAPVTLTYDAAAGGFLIGAPLGGTLAYDPASDGGATLELAVPGFGTLNFSVTGVPAGGDRLTIAGNAGATGDNRNALALSALKDAGILGGGRSTLAQGYERTVTEVASRTSGLAQAADAQERLLQEATTARDAASGVNLDEEAAELLRYQQAYEAAARVIAVSNELFQSFLRATGG